MHAGSLQSRRVGGGVAAPRLARAGAGWQRQCSSAGRLPDVGYLLPHALRVVAHCVRAAEGPEIDSILLAPCCARASSGAGALELLPLRTHGTPSSRQLLLHCKRAAGAAPTKPQLLKVGAAREAFASAGCAARRYPQSARPDQPARGARKRGRGTLPSGLWMEKQLKQRVLHSPCTTHPRTRRQEPRHRARRCSQP